MKQNDIYERVIRTMIDESREENVLHDEMYLELEERRSRMENSNVLLVVWNSYIYCLYYY